LARILLCFLGKRETLFMGEGGKLDDIKGRLKEAAGSLLGDEDMKREGTADQPAGTAKKKADELSDRARDAVRGDDEKA
jgi:uncharacterized protein YjbJ (UPF0337 family)